MVIPEDIDVLVIGQSSALATRISRMMGRVLSGRYQPCDEARAGDFLLANRYMVLILGNPSGFEPGFLESIHRQQPQARLIMFESEFSINGPLLDEQASRLDMDLLSVLPLPCPPERLEAVVERLNTASLEKSIDRAPMSIDEVSSAVALTDTLRLSPRLCQSPNSFRLSEISLRVSGTMTSESSAAGMKSRGGSMDPSASNHRANASKPTTRPSDRRTLGWYHAVIFP